MFYSQFRLMNTNETPSVFTITMADVKMPKGITCLTYIQVVLTAISSFFFYSLPKLTFAFRSFAAHVLAVLDSVLSVFGIYFIDCIVFTFSASEFCCCCCCFFCQESLQSAHRSFKNRNMASM